MGVHDGAHARPVADYEGQVVPPPPDVLRRQRDHPREVVINPPLQPQLKVFVDLVSDNDE